MVWDAGRGFAEDLKPDRCALCVVGVHPPPPSRCWAKAGKGWAGGVQNRRGGGEEGLGLRLKTSAEGASILPGAKHSE